ncbi:MAG: 2-oxo acid dehydrogenase subunit E2 [Chitinophagales bacterium]|nr:2-oxo acid dehydrogenase subunit E2 [Chitinophagales bacterium]
MADYYLLLPKMGESVFEATIITWNKQVGDTINENETIVEVATDKVDSEVPCPVSGTIKELLHQDGDVVEVGKPLAIIEVEGNIPQNFIPEEKETKVENISSAETQNEIVEEKIITTKEAITEPVVEEKITIKETPKENITTVAKENIIGTNDGFFSPLVMNIASTEKVSMQELSTIKGSGLNGRITKEDILAFVDWKKNQPKENIVEKTEAKAEIAKPNDVSKVVEEKKSTITNGNEIIEMDRMRKLIAKHMVNSKHTAPHVSSFVECDMTNIVNWRNKHKTNFEKKYKTKLSFMPMIVEAICKAIKDFPMINISVEGDTIIKKKTINIGIATALPSGNLIVPVIKNTDKLNLLGIAENINQLIDKARKNQLSPDDIQDGTYTISNIGTFGNILGTPIINQPQVAIMAVGSIEKKPAVLEIDGQDVIAIRHKMYLSHTYDHRVVDGSLGGMFVKRVADYLENFDVEQDI